MPFWIILLLILYTCACLFLIFVILIQSGSKGGGLSSLGASSQQLSDALGATGAEKTLNKLTTYSAVGFMVLAIILSIGISKNVTRDDQILEDEAPVVEPLTGASIPPLPAGATGADLLPSDLGPADQAPDSGQPAFDIAPAGEPAVP